MDFIVTIIFISTIYACYKIIVATIFIMGDNSTPEEVSGFTNDEPDGSNYVTLPSGERRLD